MDAGRRRTVAPAGLRPGGGKPNPILLVILALVAVVAIGRVALPSLTGGGTIRSFGTITVPRALAKRSAPAPPAGAPSAAVARAARNPFAPAPGFAH